MKSVYSAVRTGSLNKAVCASSLKGHFTTDIRNSVSYIQHSRYKWLPGLRRGSVAACLLGLCNRIPPESWMSVCCECCMLSGSCLGVALITRPEESYRLWCVVVCDLKTSIMRKPWPTGCCCAMGGKLFNALHQNRDLKIVVFSCRILYYYKFDLGIETSFRRKHPVHIGSLADLNVQET